MSENEFEAFGLKIHKNSHPDMKKIRRQSGAPSIHGNKFWKSTLLLMDYLSEVPVAPNARVLDVGCGFGLGGIFCAKTFEADVTSLDADKKVFPFLLHQARLNRVDVRPWVNRFERVRKADLAGFDMLIGADICFWDSMSSVLYNLIRRASQVGGIRIVLTDPGRPPFREVAERVSDTTDAEYLEWHVSHPHNTSGLVLDIQT